MGKKLPKKIQASKQLQHKVGTGVIDADKIMAAQKIMDGNDVDFAPLARPELDRLQTAIDEAAGNLNNGNGVLDSFRTPIMNLKANAGSFNYKFISDLTGIVLTLLEGIDKPDRKIIQIVDVLHKTILLALAYKMEGDGGDNGKTLVKAFEKLCRNYKPAT